MSNFDERLSKLIDIKNEIPDPVLRKIAEQMIKGAENMYRSQNEINNKKMIELTLISKISGRVITKSYTARQLLDLDEDTVVQDMSCCDCQPIGETNVVDCNCDAEWEDYNLDVDGI